MERLHMKQFKYIVKHNKLLWIVLSSIIAFFLAIGIIYVISFLLGPPDLFNEQNTIYYSDEGEIIGVDQGDENRYWVSLDEISPHMIDAIIAAEDQHFYQHSGFDLKRIISALFTDFTSLSLKEGASTITQQYARNLYLTHEKTWLRKLKEAFYTIRLEMHYSKDEILEGYLNTIYFGHQTYGVETASRYFFAKQAQDLTIAEAAMLAGIPKGPNTYSPINYEKRAQTRQTFILKQLKEQGKITKDDYHQATLETIDYADDQEVQNHTNSSYFQDEVLKEAREILKEKPEDIRAGGYKIYTTLYGTLQSKLINIIKDEIDEESDIQLGSIVMDPDSGAVRALIGGRDYEQSPFNRATQARRMAGSTFKPFLYYVAIENNYTPSTQLLSEPTTFEHNEEIYKPTNYNNNYANKPITLAQALAVSDNIYAVKTHLFLGVEELAQASKTFGFSTSFPAVPSLALGTASVTVEEMAHAYSMLANGGHDVESFMIKKIVDQDGKVIFERENNNEEQILDEQTTFILTDLLTGTFDARLNGYASVTGSPIIDKLSQKYAGKSGSTKHDSWMIGYSPELLTSVWVGYDDHRELKQTPDHTYAKQIWAKFMEEAHKNKDELSFTPPNGLVRLPIDPDTGQIATPYCPTSRPMYFKEGTEPLTHCREHLPAHPDGNEEQKEPKQKGEKSIFEKLFDLFLKQ